MTKYCLEVALAEHTAIESRSIKNKFESNEISPREIESILKAHSSSLPDGYRNYDCIDFGGPDEAHKILAAQIAYTTPDMNVSLTDLATVKSQFLSNQVDVPIYIVSPINSLTVEQRRIAKRYN